MTLQVAFNNQIISNSVVFEYKARALPTLPSSQHDWLSLDGKKGVRVTLPSPKGKGHLGTLSTRCEKGGRPRCPDFCSGPKSHLVKLTLILAFPWDTVSL